MNMCDTLYKKIESGFIFGKNSDRSPNEPNLTVYYPPINDGFQSTRCTYIEVATQQRKHAIMMTKPSWMWGAEMGVNDAGVIIGNEAVFTTSSGKKTPRLIGMDMIRLALEQSDSAQNAVDTILALLSTYGQGGNCGFDKPFYYDNSFLICDRIGAYILETSGKEWILSKIDDCGNISNRLRDDAVIFASSPNAVLPFAKKHAEPIFSFFSGSKTRSSTASCYLNGKDLFDVKTMMSALSSHRDSNLKKRYSQGSLQSVCMHKSVLGDHTTGSIIVHSRPTFDTIWQTGCSTPCLSLYKPTYFGIVVPPIFTNEAASFSYWLDREWLVRAIYAGLIDQGSYQKKREELQTVFIEKDMALFANTPTQALMQKCATECSQAEQAFIDSYRKEIDLLKSNGQSLPPQWAKLTKKLGKNVFSPELSIRMES